jgi:hypothetical protein
LITPHPLARVTIDSADSANPISAGISGTIGMGHFRLVHGFYLHRGFVGGRDDFAHAIRLPLSRTDRDTVLFSSYVC